jgi:Class III cytochrome C family
VKRGWLLILIALNLAALIALAFAYPHLMLSPGALLRGHAELTTDCFACHAPWRGAASKLCIDCHALSDIGLRSTKGAPLPAKAAKVAFHQELTEQDCMACHSDHEGPRQARRSRKAFSHELLRTATRERCEACHRSPADKLHQRIRTDCQRCHVAQHWKPATLDHAKLFVLDRDHDVKCETCHERGDFSRYTCYGCHEHRPEAMRAKHQEEGIRNFENCVECHRSANEKPRENGSREGSERGGERSGERGERRRERD